MMNASSCVPHDFFDHCPGCRPALFDSQTGHVLPEDSPTMICVMKAWRGETTYAEHRGFIMLTAHSSTNAQDLLGAQSFMAKLHAAFKREGVAK